MQFYLFKTLIFAEAELLSTLIFIKIHRYLDNFQLLL